MSEAVAEVHQLRTQVQGHAVPETTDELQVRTKEIAKESAKRARECMHRKQEERAKRARIQISTT